MLRPGFFFFADFVARMSEATSGKCTPPPDFASLHPGYVDGNTAREFFYRAAPIERSTASLGQQSTLRPAFFWYAPSAARVFMPALPSTLSA